MNIKTFKKGLANEEAWPKEEEPLGLYINPLHDKVDEIDRKVNLIIEYLISGGK